jgi:hypothetical protein
MSGDTVASVLVGGMMTVLNGHFTMHTGDEVQWYFDFEADMFQHGSTLDTPNGFPESALPVTVMIRLSRANAKKETTLWTHGCLAQVVAMANPWGSLSGK